MGKRRTFRIKKGLLVQGKTEGATEKEEDTVIRRVMGWINTEKNNTRTYKEEVRIYRFGGFLTSGGWGG